MNEGTATSCPNPVRTTEQWWDETRTSDARLVDWLQRQFHAEILAGKLMREHLERYTDQIPAWAKLHLEVIRQQETMHGKWIAELLRARGVEPKILTRRERFFEEVLPHIRSFDAYVASVFLTEEMALEKDVVVSTHPMTPPDVRAVFCRLRVDELFHSGFYGLLARPEAVEEMRPRHQAAMQAIGLLRQA